MKQEIKDIIEDKNADKYTVAQALFDYWQLQPKEAKKPYNDD